MADDHTLLAEKRTQTGSISCRRLRKAGTVPGNLYGHQVDPVMISASEDAVNSMVQAGVRVLEVEVNGNTEKAMFREVQWNTFGNKILHFDLVRIDADERVTVEVPVELRGISPGVLAGGILDRHSHTLSLECPAFELPESIPVRINDLEIGDAVHVSDLDLPASFEIHNPPETLIVQVSAPQEEEEELEAEGVEPGPTEPEVIGRKEEKEEESDD